MGNIKIDSISSFNYRSNDCFTSSNGVNRR